MEEAPSWTGDRVGRRSIPAMASLCVETRRASWYHKATRTKASGNISQSASDGGAHPEVRGWSIGSLGYMDGGLDAAIVSIYADALGSSNLQQH